MELLNQVSESIGVYFNALTQFGYKKQSDVNKLLMYTFIEELLTGEMRYYITEEDYRLIERALSCLYGSSCLIPYPHYINNDYLFGHWGDNSLTSVRFTENNNVRFTENDLIRFKAFNHNG